MKRPVFARFLGVFAILVGVPLELSGPWAGAEKASPQQFHVNAQQLQQTLEKLSEFGRPPGTGFEGGVTRLGFSEEDLAAREYVVGLMQQVGLDRKSTRLNSSHIQKSRMPSSA